MRHQRKPFNPVKLMIFTIIGAMLIVFTDLVILEGKQNVTWFSGAVNEAVNDSVSAWLEGNDDNLIEVTTLRQQHKNYMHDGIEMPAQLVAQSRPVSLLSPVGKQASEGLTLAQSVPLDDLIERERLEELAAIQPALGVDNDLEGVIEYSDVFERKNVLETIVEKDMGDVLSALNSNDMKSVHEIHEEVVIDVVAEKITETQYAAPSARGQVVIIIDDMGLTLRSKQVEVMQGPLTLAYLPYAKGLDERTARAKSNGHELMVHMPMEAMNGKLDGGPRVLKGSLDHNAFMDTVEWGLSQFDGYVGVNNHMGSRLTQDKDAMRRVMGSLKERGVFFIDSKTIGSSVAVDMARESGIAYAERDVFLDHEISMDFVRGALKKLEKVAYRKGYAIAIGHPHKETIAALKEWLPTLEGKGLTLVPASAVVTRPVAVNDNLVAGRDPQ